MVTDEHFQMRHGKVIPLLILLSAALIGGGVYFAMQDNEIQNEPSDEQGSKNRSDSSPDVSQNIWQFDGSEWRALGTPPACPDPLVFDSPVDVSRVTSILYPGQTRGGNYKPHGGFRFDTIEDNQMEVTVPMDSVVTEGARYLVGGEIQYTFDFIAPCGVMFRLGHLLTLSPKFQEIADTFPAARENDSRTTQVNPPISVKAGENIATAIGVKADTNTFVDFGVYDLRKTNSASQNSTWAGEHAEGKSLEWYAICWFDNLGPDDSALVKSLPSADSQGGKTSDYCK